MKTLKYILVFIGVLGGVTWVVNRIFNDDVRYVCEVCDRVFDSKDALITHKDDEHSNKVKCEICNKKFDNLAKLNAHKDEEHAFKCKESGCNARFSSENELNAHIVATHYKPKPDTTSTKRTVQTFYCKKCGKTIQYDGTEKAKKAHSRTCKGK